MKLQPKNQIAKDAVKVWRMKATLYMLGVWLLAIAGSIAIKYFSLPIIYIIISILFTIILSIVFIYLIPSLRYRRWRYEIFEQEIYIQRGILIMKRTLVPMIRVQHVDTEQGPILKRYGLATVSISTAAIVHEIPALNEEEATILRDRISVLARVEDEDV